jgi:hypothetical protein
MDRPRGSVTWAARQRGGPLGGRGPRGLEVLQVSRQGPACPIPIVENTLQTVGTSSGSGSPLGDLTVGDASTPLAEWCSSTRRGTRGTSSRSTPGSYFNPHAWQSHQAGTPKDRASSRNACRRRIGSLGRARQEPERLIREVLSIRRAPAQRHSECQDDQHRPFNRPPDAELTSVSAGQPGCGAPRRNRTGDPILTMEPPGTAVRTAVSPGHARP